MRELYLGMISGTSCDAIDVALVDFADEIPKLVASIAHPFPGELKARVLALSQSRGEVSIEALGQLDTALGRVFALAANELLHRHDVDRREIRALGSHGQTIWHAPTIREGFSMQLGDANIIAERTGIDVIADFRRRDIAAGGQGAPLVPAFHAALVPIKPASVVLNLGGIANITVLRRPLAPVSGFDTGPANALMDAWCLRHTGQSFDRDSAFASSGEVIDELLARLLFDPYFSQLPPKSTGRDKFNLTWLERQLSGTEDPSDVQRTLLELSAQSIADAIIKHAPDAVDIWLCGGGVHNRLLRMRLIELLAPRNVRSTAFLGLDPDFMEAMAFAWLARCFVKGQSGSLSAVTGARSERRLGALHPK